jgi:hypothetical protein
VVVVEVVVVGWVVEPEVVVDVVVLVVVAVVVDVVVVLVVDGEGVGTCTLARNLLLIVSGGSTRSTSWIRFARTRIEHTVPGARLRLGVSLNVDAGDELSENLFPRPLGHSSPNDRFVARTRSLKRTDSTPAADIETDTTRGAASAEDESGTSPVSHEVPPAADTPAVRPNGTASATATTFHQQRRKRALPATAYCKHSCRTERTIGTHHRRLEPDPETQELEWARQDSNLGPTDYESAALTAELRARTSRA